MSVEVTTRVTCDGAGCQRQAPGHVGPSVDRPMARTRAGMAGWTTKGRRDLCPTCTAKEAA